MCARICTIKIVQDKGDDYFETDESSRWKIRLETSTKTEKNKKNLICRQRRTTNFTYARWYAMIRGTTETYSHGNAFVQTHVNQFNYTHMLLSMCARARVYVHMCVCAFDASCRKNVLISLKFRLTFLACKIPLLVCIGVLGSVPTVSNWTNVELHKLSKKLRVSFSIEWKRRHFKSKS